MNCLKTITLSLLLFMGMTHYTHAQVLSQHSALQQTLDVIPEGSVLKSTFTQKRHLKDIPHALTSMGEILLWAGKGLIWRTKTPFPSTILMTQRGLYQMDQNKKTPLIREGKMAADGAILDIFSKVLKGAFSDLKGFTIENLQPKKSQWCIRLLPPPAIGKVISSLVIEGAENGNLQYIKHITINRPNGDRDEITLEKPQIYHNQDTDNALTSQEQAWLND